MQPFARRRSRSCSCRKERIGQRCEVGSDNAGLCQLAAGHIALLSREARNVPGMLFIGGKDMDSSISAITGLFAVNRSVGALWALTNEPGAAHVVGRSLELARMFFEDVLSARVAAALRPMLESDGFVADLKTKTFQPAGALATRSFDGVASYRAGRARMAGNGNRRGCRALVLPPETCRQHCAIRPSPPYAFPDGNH